MTRRCVDAPTRQGPVPAAPSQQARDRPNGGNEPTSCCPFRTPSSFAARIGALTLVFITCTVNHPLASRSRPGHPQPWRSQPESICICAQATNRTPDTRGRAARLGRALSAPFAGRRRGQARGRGATNFRRAGRRAEGNRFGEKRKGWPPSRFCPFRRPGRFATPYLRPKPNTTAPWRAS